MVYPYFYKKLRSGTGRPFLEFLGDFATKSPCAFLAKKAPYLFLIIGL